MGKIDEDQISLFDVLDGGKAEEPEVPQRHQISVTHNHQAL